MTRLGGEIRERGLGSSQAAADAPLQLVLGDEGFAGASCQVMLLRREAEPTHGLLAAG